jgi:NAD-dependent deacetylase
MKIVVLTGAGMSAESGIQTFRDAGGLWENYRVEDVASPDGWKRNPTLVLEFYNQRRRQMHQVAPNAGHLALAKLEEKHEVCIITQNIDNLHERAGSSDIIHLHGELFKARSVNDLSYVREWTGDIQLGDNCPKGHQMRPHIVWFGEAVPLIYPAAEIVAQAEYIIVIGSSMQVYPAAGLVASAQRNVPVVYIDPHPAINYELKHSKKLEVIVGSAAVEVPILVKKLLA